MAKTKFNGWLQNIRGLNGDVVFKTFLGRPYVAQPPKQVARTPSEAQLAQREQFAAAVRHARTVLQSPAQREFYARQARERVLPILSVIVTDFLSVPVIRKIDVEGYLRRVGDPIVVQADDDTEVTAVTVTVRAEDGSVVETGPAQFVDGVWRYLATVAPGPISPLMLSATATDRPGHTGTATLLVAGTAPVVDEVDVSGYHGRIGDPILVRARDDVAVNEVIVTIRSAAQVELESGPALLVDGAYRYAAQTAIAAGTPVAIEGLASDADAHSTAKTVNIVVG